MFQLGVLVSFQSRADVKIRKKAIDPVSGASKPGQNSELKHFFKKLTIFASVICNDTMRYTIYSS